MANLTPKLYTEYFRNIAVKNKLIRHNPNSENPNSPSGQSYFAIFELHEIFAKLKSSLGKERVSLLITMYEFQGFNRKTTDYRVRYTASFTVVKKALKNEIASQEDAREDSEIVTWQIINKLIQESVNPDVKQCDKPFGKLELDDFKVVAVGPIWENHYGNNITFDFTKDVNKLIDPANIAIDFDE